MKNKQNSSSQLSRRKFLGTAAIVATGILLPSVVSYGNNTSRPVSQTDNGLNRIPNSQFAGVQIGAITYSFRDLKGGLEATLNACVEAGLNSVELMGTGVEDYLGAPKNPVQRRPGPNNAIQKNTNQVWGQGETPLAEVLHLIRDQKLPIYCDIELEYPVNPWSTSVKEVNTCKEFCRQILI